MCRGVRYGITRKAFLSAFSDCNPKKEITPLFTSAMLNLSVDELETQTNSVNFVNKRFVASQKSVLVAADSGAGKTTLILQLLIAWALGKEVLGFQPHSKIRSLYIGNEDDPLIIQSLFKASKKMAGLTDEELKTAADNITIPETYSWDIFALAEQLLSSAPYHLVVINPMSNFIVEDLNSSKAPQEFYSRLDHLQRKYNVATMVVCHNNKAGEIAGNKGFENKFRHAITITRVAEGADVFRLKVKKGYFAAGFHHKFIKYNDVCPEHFYWLPVDEKNVPCKDVMSENTKKILMAIPFGPVENISVKEIQKTTDIPGRTIRSVLANLTKTGAVIKWDTEYPAVYHKPAPQDDGTNATERQNNRVASRQWGR